MKTERLYLQGFPLKGGWKALIADRDAGEDRWGKHGVKVKDPQAWEFTNYPEDQLTHLTLINRKKQK